MRFAFSDTQAHINYMLRTERMPWSERKEAWRHIGSLAASSNRANAATTSPTQDMLPSKCEPL
jgi:hypothetical protein